MTKCLPGAPCGEPSIATVQIQYCANLQPSAKVSWLVHSAHAYRSQIMRSLRVAASQFMSSCFFESKEPVTNNEKATCLSFCVFYHRWLWPQHSFRVLYSHLPAQSLHHFSYDHMTIFPRESTSFKGPCVCCLAT